MYFFVYVYSISIYAHIGVLNGYRMIPGRTRGFKTRFKKHQSEVPKYEPLILDPGLFYFFGWVQEYMRYGSTHYGSDPDRGPFARFPEQQLRPTTICAPVLVYGIYTRSIWLRDGFHTNGVAVKELDVQYH